MGQVYLRLEAVEDDDVVTALDEVRDQMRADEAGAARDKDPLAHADSLPRPGRAPTAERLAPPAFGPSCDPVRRDGDALPRLPSFDRRNAVSPHHAHAA